MRRTWIKWGRPLFPSETHGRGERMERTNFFKCQQCGFENDCRKAGWERGPASGNVKVSNPTLQVGEKASVHTYDWQTKGFCALCGSPFWTPVKQRALPMADQRVPCTRAEIKRARAN